MAEIRRKAMILRTKEVWVFQTWMKIFLNIHNRNGNPKSTHDPNQVYSKEFLRVYTSPNSSLLLVLDSDYSQRKGNETRFCRIFFRLSSLNVEIKLLSSEEINCSSSFFDFALKQKCWIAYWTSCLCCSDEPTSLT